MIPKMILSILFTFVCCSGSITAETLKDLQEKIARKERKLIILQEKIENELDPTTLNILNNRLRKKKHRIKQVQQKLENLR